MTANSWGAFLTTRRQMAATPEERALVDFVADIVALTERCALDCREGPTLNRVWLVQRMGDALTTLINNVKENHDG